MNHQTKINLKTHNLLNTPNKKHINYEQDNSRTQYRYINWYAYKKRTRDHLHDNQTNEQKKLRVDEFITNPSLIDSPSDSLITKKELKIMTYNARGLSASATSINHLLRRTDLLFIQ